MEKINKLSESDLEKIVKQVIKESERNRIVTSSSVTSSKIRELIENGYIPYYLDFNKSGNYKIVKVTDFKDRLSSTTIYFLTENEYRKLKKLVENVNDLTSALLEEIELRRKQIIGVLEQVIMK